jgi:hypothetical protein
MDAPVDVSSLSFKERNLRLHPIFDGPDHLQLLEKALENMTHDFDESFMRSEKDGAIKTARNLKTPLFETPRQQWENSLYPAFRELLQNVLDHLMILKEDSLRHRHVKVTTERVGLSRDLVFWLTGLPTADKEVMRILLFGDNKIVVRQQYTFPLHPNTLMKGVSDEHKQNNNAAVGGFGCGMKELFRELLAWEGAGVKYEMWGGPTQFVRQTLELDPPLLHSDRFRVGPELSVRRISRRTSRHNQPENTMAMTIELPGLVGRFIEDVLPRCSLFWDRREITENWISCAKDAGSDGSWICLARHVRLASEVMEWAYPEWPEGQIRCAEDGVYSCGLFVEKNKEAPMEEKTIVNFGWGSDARCPTSARSHLLPQTVKRQLGIIVTNAATEAERSRAKDCLNYLLVGRPADAEPKLLWTSNDFHGLWENVLSRRKLYQLLGFSGDPLTLFVQKPKTSQGCWALETMKALATMPCFWGEFADPPFAYLEDAKTANVFLFPQMPEVDMLTKALTMAFRYGGTGYTTQSRDWNHLLPSSTPVFVCDHWGSHNGIYDTAMMAIGPSSATAGGAGTMSSHPPCGVAYLILRLVTEWLELNRPGSAGDDDRAPSQGARTRKVVQIASDLCTEPFAFHRRGDTLAIVTPREAVHWNGDEVNVRVMREMLMTLTRYEGDLGGRALCHGVMLFGHMFHDKKDSDFLGMPAVREWYAATLACLNARASRDEDTAESVRGREEEDVVDSDTGSDYDDTNGTNEVSGTDGDGISIAAPRDENAEFARPHLLAPRIFSTAAAASAASAAGAEPFAPFFRSDWETMLRSVRAMETPQIFHTLKRARVSSHACERELRRRMEPEMAAPQPE